LAMFHPSMSAFFRDKLKRNGGRLLAALSCYGVLALVAGFALEGFLRGALLCFIAILAAKTIAHAGDEKLDPDD